MVMEYLNGSGLLMTQRFDAPQSLYEKEFGIQNQFKKPPTLLEDYIRETRIKKETVKKPSIMNLKVKPPIKKDLFDTGVVSIIKNKMKEKITEKKQQQQEVEQLKTAVENEKQQSVKNKSRNTLIAVGAGSIAVIALILGS